MSVNEKSGDLHYSKDEPSASRSSLNLDRCQQFLEDQDIGMAENLQPKQAEQPDLSWQVCDRFLELRTNWLTLIGEHLRDHQDQLLEYWRIERADSVVILPIQDNQLLLPSPAYRPGVSATTLDFPGGRVTIDQNPAEVAPMVLKRELGTAPELIERLVPINQDGWAVNSSFSNQKLYGFVAYLKSAPSIDPEHGTVFYSITSVGIKQLLTDLTCLQCRALLLEWWLNRDQS